MKKINILIVRSYCPTRILYGDDMRVSRFSDYFSRFAQWDLLTLVNPTDLADTGYSKSQLNNYREEYK